MKKHITLTDEDGDRIYFFVDHIVAIGKHLTDENRLMNAVYTTSGEYFVVQEHEEDIFKLMDEATREPYRRSPSIAP